MAEDIATKFRIGDSKVIIKVEETVITMINSTGTINLNFNNMIIEGINSSKTHQDSKTTIITKEEDHKESNRR